MKMYDDNHDRVLHNVLTPQFLFIHDHCTTLEFIHINIPEEGIEYPSREFDLARRICRINYIDGNKFSDLAKFTRKRQNFESGTSIKVPMFKFLSDQLIDESYDHLRFLTCDTYVKINGLRYWFLPCHEFFTIQIYDGEKVPCPNSIFCSRQSVMIYLNSEIVNNFDLKSWLEFCNRSSYIRCEKEDDIEFNLIGFRTLDLKKRPIDVTYTENYNDSTESMFINSEQIIAGFIRTLRAAHPDFTFNTSIYDLYNQKQKKKLLFYTARLPEIGDNAGPPIENPYYGIMRQTNIGMSWEFLTDDWEEYLWFRDSAILNTGFFRNTSFKISDAKGDQWSYGVDWNTEVSNEIERSPQTVGLEDTALFTVKFECTINGWIVEKYNENVKTILYPIARFYTDDWKFVGALFDRTDPNVYTGYALKIDDQYFLVITGDRKYPKDFTKFHLTLNYLGPDERLLVKYDTEHKMHDWNAFDSGIVDLNLEIPINPLDLEHGVLYEYQAPAKQIFKDTANQKEFLYITDETNFRFDVNKFLDYAQNNVTT